MTREEITKDLERNKGRMNVIAHAWDTGDIALFNTNKALVLESLKAAEETFKDDLYRSYCANR